MFRFELKRCMKGRGFKAAFLISLILAAGHFTAFCICFLHNEYGGIITDKEAVKLLKAGQSVLGIYPANIFEGFIGGEQYTFWNGVSSDLHRRMRFYALQEGLLPPVKTFPLPEGVLKVPL